jgi:hypothetical protein
LYCFSSEALKVSGFPVFPLESGDYLSIHRSIVCLGSFRHPFSHTRREANDELLGRIGGVSRFVSHTLLYWRLAIEKINGELPSLILHTVWRLATIQEMATRHIGNTVNQPNQKYILRFELPGHRDRLKDQAAAAKRSLNRQLLLLLEAGERALYPHEDPQSKGSKQ